MAGMMQTPGMQPFGMQQAPGMAAAPGMYGCPLPPAGLVNLDVDSAPGLATLDTDYPLQLGVAGGMMAHHGYAQMTHVSSETYIVKKGDTVYKIARRFGTTMNAIIQTNNLNNPNLIFPGQLLYIPA